jgi:pyruvate dehydrogenase E1 component alpha subunit
VGSALALGPEDWVFPSYREHGVLQSRGVDLKRVLRLFRGADNGGWDSRAHRVHLYTLVVAAQVLPAVGYAMGMALDGSPGAVIVYLGDGATSQGEVGEALVWAASCQAPVLFWIQNNGWAISTPTQVQARVALARRGEGFGVPGQRVDGNDADACWTAAAAALERIRAGQGPQLVEALTYRMGPHTTSDDPSRYRRAAEEAEWAARDPLALARSRLEADGLADAAFFAEVDAAAAALAADARRYCLGIERPALADWFDWAYAAEHSLVASEKAAFAADRAAAPGGR